MHKLRIIVFWCVCVLGGGGQAMFVLSVYDPTLLLVNGT
jgi:Tfp pilus tip-associated adhesin PilY1